MLACESRHSCRWHRQNFTRLFFSDQAGIPGWAWWGNETACRLIQFATLRTTNGSPCISRHRSYKTQPRKWTILPVFYFYFNFQENELGMAKNSRSAALQVTKEYSIPVNVWCVMCWRKRHQNPLRFLSLKRRNHAKPVLWRLLGFGGRCRFWDRSFFCPGKIRKRCTKSLNPIFPAVCYTINRADRKGEVVVGTLYTGTLCRWYTMYSVPTTPSPFLSALLMV